MPIVGPEALVAEQPDHTLLVAWNLTDEIIEQQRAYRAAGGRFIVPLPEPRVIDRAADRIQRQGVVT